MLILGMGNAKDGIGIRFPGSYFTYLLIQVPLPLYGRGNAVIFGSYC
jgi:hypothetical protein